MNWVPQSIAFPVGEQLLYGGLGLALVLSLIQQRLAGLGAAFKMIEIFADTLSYLRLYALGLASMVLAATFNEIGMKVGYLFGGLIILFGHCINITLGVSAGLIHGLRLNFLEWYHHCFEGGGKKFNPLKLFVRE
jgi:V/A-type H+-transporting ATPase subunit I